ncbi:MAG: O-antigen ligase family protein [Bdellovibrionales bacterium]|nr:O-antigen ligase family protein [Oligoflexia bacterium]
MENAAATLFQLDFKQDVFALLGIIYFTLLMYWLVSLWKSLKDAVEISAAEKSWFVFSALGGIAFSAVTMSEWGVPAMGTSIALGLCIGLALMNSSAAACLLASSLYLRPWELVPNDAYLVLLPRLSIILCLGHLFLHFAKIGKFDFKWNQMSLLLVAFSVWTLLTTVFAPDPGAAQGEFFDGFLKSILLYFILVQTVRTPDALKRLLVTLLLSFLFVGSICVYQTLRMNSLVTEGDLRLRGFGAFTNSNDIAALMVFILPFAAIAALRKNENTLIRALGFALSFVSIITIVLSRSRGALMGIALMIAVHFIIKIGRKAVVPVAAALLFLALPASIIISNRSSTDLEGSSAGRKTYLKAGLRMGVLNPIFGVGFNGFPASLQTYSTESLEEDKQMTAHNSWVLVFAETGPIGLILFTLVFVFCLRSAWTVYSRSPEFLLAMVGYGVAMFFLSHSYLIYPYLLFALVQLALSFHTLVEPETEPYPQAEWVEV